MLLDIDPLESNGDKPPSTNNDVSPTDGPSDLFRACLLICRLKIRVSGAQTTHSGTHACKHPRG